MSYNEVYISGMVVDHLNVSSDVVSPFSTIKPTEWTEDTIMDGDYDDNVSVDKSKIDLSEATSVKIKRREKGTFNWTTIVQIPINSTSDLKFAIVDVLNKNNFEYEYAFVPMIQDIEMTYIIREVSSSFDSTFLCDGETIYKMLAQVNYGQTESHQQIGTYEPIGKKYPIIISNAKTNYKSGSVSAVLLNDDYCSTGIINRQAIVEKEKIVNDFLKNKEPKVLKDFNGNMWLVVITGNPSTTYSTNYGNGIFTIEFNWVEQGNADNHEDLLKNNFIPNTN